MSKKVVILVVIFVVSFFLQVAYSQRFQLQHVGSFKTGRYNVGAAEIVAHDPVSQRLFSVNGDSARVDIISINNPASPTRIAQIDVRPLGSANSVAVRDGIVAVAVEDANKQAPGKVAFYNANGVLLKIVIVGALPDMITFSPNGQLVLTANEGEPNDAYTVDPEGSVSIIDISGGLPNLTQANVVNVGFADFNVGGSRRAEMDTTIRIFGPGATVARDLEPEYVTVSADSRTAWVTLQENNALAIIDIPARRVTSLKSLGTKNHNLVGKGLDASDQDNAVNIRPWKILGMYQPDAISSYVRNGRTYLVTANEGDARAYTGYTEEITISRTSLDTVVFPVSDSLWLAKNLGRLKFTKAGASTDADPEFEVLRSFGTRSFSIWDAAGTLVFDSGDWLEQVTAAANASNFNASNTNNTRDNRSDDKGPEPEGVVLATLGDSVYAFIGMERIGGFAVFNISNPVAPSFVQYVNNRNFSITPGNGTVNTVGDLGPEGIMFIPAGQSPNGRSMIVTANEISGTVSLFEINVPAVVANGGFEQGTANWTLFSAAPNGIHFSSVPSGPSGSFAKVHINATSNNMQVYQTYFPLTAGTKYRLAFDAYSPTSRRVFVTVHKHNAPYGSYGFGEWIQLGPNWTRYERQFTAGGFSGTTTDTRLRFYFVYACAAGDDYYFDNVSLVQVLAKAEEDQVVERPTAFLLEQNYPNPFNPMTTIRFSIPTASNVSLKIYNTIGQEVATLIDGLRPAGEYTHEFDATSMSSGLYFYRLEAGGLSDVKKLMVLK